MPLDFSEILTEESIFFTMTLLAFRKLPVFLRYAIRVFRSLSIIARCDIRFIALEARIHPDFLGKRCLDLKSLLLKSGRLRQKSEIHS